MADLGWVGGCGGPPVPSEVLEAAVELPLAALARPGTALQAELAQVLLEVLVVHGAIVLGLTV